MASIFELKNTKSGERQFFPTKKEAMSKRFFYWTQPMEIYEHRMGPISKWTLCYLINTPHAALSEGRLVYPDPKRC